MNWFKRAIIKWAMRGADDDGPKLKMPASLGVKEDHQDNDTVRFHLSPAVGGRILRVTRETHRPTTGFNSESQTYVIPSGEDVGARVAKIINLEVLK